MSSIREIYTMDNYTALRSINDKSIDLIYIDPPFNSNFTYKGQNEYILSGEKFIDKWDENNTELLRVSQNLLEIVKNHPLEIRNYSIMMVSRIAEFHRILKDTGSLYIHCDYNASHYLKIILDSIFGAKNFINEIIWKRSGSKGTKGKRRSFGRTTDTILFYSKTSSYKFEIPKTFDANKNKDFKHIDDNGKYRAVTPLYGDPFLLGGTSHYQWNGHNPPHGWRVSLTTLKRLHEENRIHYNKNNRPYRKEYQSEYTGQDVTNLWDDISLVSGNERTGYPTQKPLALIERIITASSDKGDLVLDAFCGSGTTCIAAEKLERQWIGMDISNLTYDLVCKRLKENGSNKMPVWITKENLKCAAI